VVNDNTTNDNEAQDGAGENAAATEAPAKRVRRRAAGRPAGPPPGSEGAVPDPIVVPEVSAPAEVAAPLAGEVKVVTPPSRRRRATRPTSTAAEAADVSETSPEETLPGLDAEAELEVAEVELEAAEIELEAAELEVVEVVLEAEQAVTDEAPSASRSRRSRSARRPAAAAGAVSDPAETDEPMAASTGLIGRGGAAIPPMVTFQAPDPEAAPVRRSRRRGAAQPSADIEVQEPLDSDTVDEVEGDRPPRSRQRAPRSADAADSAEAATGEETDNVEDDASDSEDGGSSRRRRRGRRGRGRARTPDGEGSAEDGDSADGESGDGETADGTEAVADGDASGDDESTGSGSSRRRRRRRPRTGGDSSDGDEPRSREPKSKEDRDEGVRGLSGSTRLEAKKQRRREGREQGRRRAPIVSEAEFLARRESVNRVMVVRNAGERTQIGVLEDDILVEHYVTRASSTSYAGNVYVGRVQNVLPSMEAAFVDIGKGRNAVLYAGEVNYDASALEGKPRKIEQALKSGQSILVQVTKDPIGHKGARLTSQISLPGRYMVYVPDGGSAGISRKLPDTERSRLKAILKKVTPEDAGVIIRTAAEGATEEELAADVQRLQAEWEEISRRAAKASPPTLLHAEPDLVIRVVRDVFNEDFTQLVVQGNDEWERIEQYVQSVAPDLAERLVRHVGNEDIFTTYRVEEQLLKGLDRKVYLPSGGSLVIDRTEAMTVIDVNTGKFTGKGGNLEETVTRNNLEAAEEVVRQLRLRDVGGIVVIDFIDMVLESNRELVLRRLTECLGRDRTRHQVAEVTSLGLVQMTRKRVGQGLLEAYSEPCTTCGGRGVLVHLDGPNAHRPVPRPLPRPPAAKPEENGEGNGDGDVAASDVLAADLAVAEVADVVDGEVVDGEVVDGEVVDGEVVDGEVVDSDVVDVDSAESSEVPEVVETRSNSRSSRGGSRSRGRNNGAFPEAAASDAAETAAVEDEVVAVVLDDASAESESAESGPAESGPAVEPDPVAVTADEGAPAAPPRRHRRATRTTAGVSATPTESTD
jgi:ribonuclease E